MNEKQARQLLPGTVVVWEDNPNDLGTIRRIGELGALIDWENGGCDWYAFSSDRMQKISIR